MADSSDIFSAFDSVIEELDEAIASVREAEPEEKRHVPSNTRPGRTNPAPHSLQKLAKEYTEEAFDTIFEIMSDSENEASTRLEAAKHILAMGWGKPSGKLEIESKHINVHETLKVLAAGVKPPEIRVEEHVDAIEVKDAAVQD
jgi:hypothetical protein